MTDHDAIWDYRDGQQARRLAEAFGLDGWLVQWERIGEGDWEATVTGPSLPGRTIGRGRSRVSAISKAHVGAIRRLRLGDVRANQSQCPDLGAGIVHDPVAPALAQPVPSP